MIKRIFLVLIAFAVLSVSLVSTTKTAEAHFNPCSFDFLHLIPGCWPSPTPSATPTPTASPEPSQSPEPTEEPTATPCVEWKGEFEEPCEPEPTVEPTPQPKQSLTQPGAPELPFCVAPLWAPTVTYDGQKGTTFSYHWTSVKEGLHDYWIDYGFTPQSLPYSMIVHEEKVSITMFGGKTNWMRVAGYDNGCRGPFSVVLN